MSGLVVVSGMALGALGGCCISLAIDAHRRGLSWWKEAFFGVGFMFAGVVLIAIGD